MPAPATDTAFSGSIPQLYDRLLVPMIFRPYADDLARRAAVRAPTRVLETAAGTGALTRTLARELPNAQIVATDLNAPMLERAKSHPEIGSRVAFQVADAMSLPFEDGAFDLVACQFGVMFFPDRAAGYAEARRVLRPGGWWVFNTWGRLGDNGFTDVAVEALARMFPDDPPRFMARTPHGYHDSDTIVRDLAAGGFGRAPHIEVVDAVSRAASAREAATALCQGTPLRNEIEARASHRLGEATDMAEAALQARFGHGPIEAGMRALAVVVQG